MKIKSITTAKDTNDRLAETIINGYQPDNTNTQTDKILIDTDTKYQQLIGFGGSFTEAASTTLDLLSSDLRKEAIDAYFHPEKGINYSFCRTHIQSCDFSLSNYAYVDDPLDTELETFSIDRDKKSLIPLIKDALKTSKNEIKIVASPWSPPGWMKTNGQMNNGGSLKQEHYETWAHCFAKYLQEYKKEGIDIWGVTVQNEPQAVTPWDNCVYSPRQEREFVKTLGKMLEKHGLSSKKIIVWDHNKDIMKERVDDMFSDPEASKWVWGVGFHWYSHDDKMNILDNSVLDYTYENYNKNLIFTEGCNPLGSSKPFIGKWWTGEKYALNIINDLNHWTRAWCDWNLCLNEVGGPNHVQNYCDAPIIADTINQKLHFNSSYYYIAHFSKYILPGAERVKATTENKNLHITAFLNQDKSLVVVIMNNSEDDINMMINCKTIEISKNIKKRSIQTYVIEA